KFAAGEGVVFAICAGNRLVGTIGLDGPALRGKLMMGDWIGEKYWNKGDASEAAREGISYAFGRLGVVRVDAYFFPENPASGRVMEKAGMKLEGTMRNYVIKDGNARDSVMYAITVEDWRKGG